MKHFITILLLQFLAFQNCMIHSQWVQTQGPYGGVVTQLTVKGGSIFAGISGDGVYLSSDKGASWSKVSNGLPDKPRIVCMTVKGNSIFAGLGNGGIYRTTDDGADWKAVNNGFPPDYSGSLNCTALAADSNAVYAGKPGSVYYSTDNGDSWKLSGYNFPPYMQVSSIVFFNHIIFASTAVGGVYYASDNGAFWKPVNKGLYMSVSSLAVKDSLIFAATYGGGVNVTGNSGAEWKEANNGITNLNINKIIAAGNNIYAATEGSGIFMSTDNGAVWKEINKGILGYMGSRALAGIDSTLFAGTTGGVYRTTDKGENWEPVNKGLGYASVTSIEFNGDKIFAGTSGAGMFISANKGSQWDNVNNGITQPIILALASNAGKIIAGTQMYYGTMGGIYITSDNGANWENKLSRFVRCLAAAKGNIFAGTYGSGVYISRDNGAIWDTASNGLTNDDVGALAISENGIFAGTRGIGVGTIHGGVYYSADEGANWKEVNKGFPTDDKVKALAVNGNKVVAGTLYDGILLSTDNGENWTMSGNGLSSMNISALVFSGNNIFAATEGGIYLSTDDAANWRNASTGLTTKSILSLAIKGDTIYAGTDAGIWYRPLSEIIIKIPDTPQLLIPINNALNIEENVRCIWRKSKLAAHYRMCLAEDAQFNTLTFCDSTLTDTLREVKKLRQGQKYYWKVRAANEAGESSFSEVWNFITLLRAPDSLSASMTANKSIRLQWKAVPNDSAAYILERKQENDFEILDTIKAGITTYTDSTITPSLQYLYRVKACTRFTVSAYSNQASVIITSAGSASRLPGEYALIQNYPNPFNAVTVLKYELPYESNVSLMLFNPLGQLIKVLAGSLQPPGYYNIRFDAGSLPSGIYIYLLEASSADGVKSYRQARKMLLLK
ncbi:MAG: T9SS type A sorting domain-containing protein [Ignavibacteriales bacterium]